MRVTYRHTFAAVCPVDGTQDIYQLEIVSERLIPVEDILAAIQHATGEPAFQEHITNRLHDELLAATAVKTTGLHSGVETVVEC